MAQRTLRVQLPVNTVPGAPLQVNDPQSGQTIELTVPHDAKPGQTIDVAVPPQAVVVPQQAAVLSVQQPGVVVQPQTVVLTTMPVIYGHFPVATRCPHCHADVVTRVEKHSGLMTWLSCGGLACVGCWLGCCLIPFCIDDLKDSHHHCPQCKNLIAVKPVIS